MKTLTEFAATTLKNALKTKTELTTAGKTAEELPAALGEALKVEGDKLSRLLEALECVGTKTDDLKRVVVMQAGEGEPSPKGAVQKGELWFLVEYFPSLTKKAEPAQGRGGRDSKGGRDRKGGKGGRGGRDGERGGSSDRGGRPPREARAPRPAPAPRDPNAPKPEGKIIIKPVTPAAEPVST